MSEALKDVGKHSGTYGDGHYEASVLDDGDVIITTIFDNAQHTNNVKLSGDQWRRLAAWVAWASTDWQKASK